MTGGWEIGNVDISLLDAGKARLSANTASAHVRSVGFKLIGRDKGFEGGGACGYGFSISASW